MAAILIEGSSTALGLYDEGPALGFSGRIQRHFNTYTEQTIDGLDQDPRAVYVYPHAQIDLYVPDYVRNLQQHINEARHKVKRGQVVGLFVVGGRPDHYARRLGREKATEVWEQGYESLRTICTDNKVDPILLAAPQVPNSIRLNNGEPADIALHCQCLGYAYDAAENLGAPLVTFEDLLGSDRERYMAPDNKHANAAGYERIYAALLPMLRHMLGIEKQATVEQRIKDLVPQAVRIPGTYRWEYPTLEEHMKHAY